MDKADILRKLDSGQLITTKDYNDKNTFLSTYYTEVSPKDFYKDIFTPDTIEEEGVMYPKGEGKPNPIVCIKKYRFNADGSPLMKSTKDGKYSYHAYFMDNRIMFNNYKVLDETCNQDFAICGLYTCWGKNSCSNHAFSLYGFCIDLDGVREKELNTLCLKFENKILPVPTYLVNSGHGIHIYYVFESPVPLIPAYKKSLERIKKGLTLMIWERDTTTYDLKDIQFQGIFQKFRMVGSHTKFATGRKKSKFIVKAFRVGKKVDLTYLNHFLEDWSYTQDLAIRHLKKDFASLSEERLPLEDAKVLYPEWYDRIQKGIHGHWVCNEGLYYWWLNQIKTNSKVREGKRFFIVSILFVYAMKCGIPYEQVEKDAIDLIPILDEKTEHSPFTLDDVIAASQMYDEKWYKMSWAFVKEKSGLDNIIPQTKRNGRPRKEHMRIMNFVRDEINQNRTWRDGNGRPDKKDMIQEWRKAHPDGRKVDCIRDTGLSKPTVYKWWQTTE